ncbi:unnamed protein product, partial [marine sediment metagenome]
NWRDRQIVKNNLRIALKEDEKNVAHYSRSVFRNFAKNLVEFFRFPKVDISFLKKFVKIEGQEYFDQAFALQKGIIGITAHLGNWELSGAVASVLGYPLDVVVLTHRHRLVDDFFTRKRAEKGIKGIPIKSSVKEFISILRNNRMLVLAGDRNFSKSGIEVNFFGKPARMPVGMATLALRLKSPVIPGFLIREKDDSFRLIIEKPIAYKASGNLDTDLKNFTRRCLEVIEKYVRKYPEQWAIFGQVWENR